MDISIFGLGYVGAVSLACLARDGHNVIGVDVEPAKLELIRAGKTPVVEEGMVDLMTSVVASGRVSVTDDVQKAIMESEISLVCVGTPSAPNGSQDQTAMQRLAHSMGKVMQRKAAPHIFVFRSTLVPGTVEDTLRPIMERESGKRDGTGFHLCFQPEFLREGSSIRDFDKPPYTIIGASSPVAVESLRRLFGHLPCELHATSIRAAEMVKYCCNNFHALKITFANETARLCEALGVNCFEVMDLVCRDRQLNISPAYLKPGFAYGGSCLPKDLRATMYLAKTHDVDMPLLAGVQQSNRIHIERAIAKVLDSGKRRIGVIGLAFKAGTDDLRESPMVLMAEHLIGKGLQLRIYDPDVHLSSLIGANRRYIEQHVPHIGALVCRDLQTVVAEAELLIVALGDRDTLDGLRAHAREDQVIVDLTGISHPGEIRGNHVGLCW